MLNVLCVNLMNAIPYMFLYNSKDNVDVVKLNKACFRCLNCNCCVERCIHLEMALQRLNCRMIHLSRE